MEIKKEEIYLDLSKISEYDKETVSSLVKFNLRLTFPYLVFEDEELKTWIQCKKECDLLENRKEINFQQFCELFQTSAKSAQVPVFNIDFGGNVMAGLKIVNGKIEVIGAINGWGDGISADLIKITKSNN